MKKGTSRESGGFTMVEMMIAVGLFGLVMAGSISVYIMCQRLWHATSLSMDTARIGSMAINRMVYGVGDNSGLRSAASIWVDTNRHKDSTSVNYWDTNTNSPPAADNVANNFCSFAPYPGDGSWRIVYSNSMQGVKYIDYIKKQRTIVMWPIINEPSSRVLIGNYVSNAVVYTNLEGISIAVTVCRKDGGFTSTNQIGTFVKKRNK